jgi:hypothetical protein
VIVAARGPATCEVVIAACPLDEPAGIVIMCCGFAAALSDVSLTGIGTSGAHDKVIVAIEFVPPCTGFGLKVSDTILIGSSFILPLIWFVPAVAKTVNICSLIVLFT